MELIKSLKIQEGLKSYFFKNISFGFRIDYSKEQIKKVNKNINFLVKKLKSIGINKLQYDSYKIDYNQINKEVAQMTFKDIEVLKWFLKVG